MEEEQKTEGTGISSKPKGGNKSYIIIGIVLILLGIGAAAAYLLLSKSSSDSGAGSVLRAVTGGKVLNPNCKYNDPDLCKFMNNWKDVKYLTMNSTDTAKDGKTYATIYKMEGDENSQITVAENGTENYNTITLGKTTYTKDYTDNKWWKYTPKDTEESLTKNTEEEINFDTKAENVEDKTTYEKMGTEACGKLTCFKYKEVDPTNTEYTQYLYFDNKDYQLRKTRTEMKDGSVSEATYDYTKFSISVPSPVKEGNPYDLNTGTTSTLPTTTTPTTSTVTPDTTDTTVDSGATDTSLYGDTTSSDDTTSYDIGE